MNSNSSDNRIYTDPFKKTDTLIFKIELPNLRDKTSGCFYIGLTENNVREHPSWGNFGGGNWYCLDVKGSFRSMNTSVKGKNNN